MKTILIAACLILAALPSLAQDNLTPVSVAASQDSATVAVDAIAVGQSVSDIGRVGLGTWWRRNVQPVQFWNANWKGILTSAAVAGAAYAAYEIYDHNKSDGSSSKSDDDDATVEMPDQMNLGDQSYVGIEGDYNVVTIYNSSPITQPAAAE